MYVTRVLTDELTMDAADPKVKDSRDGVKGVCVGDSGGGDVGVIDMTGGSGCESESDERSLKSIRKDSHSNSSSNSNGNSDSNENDNDHRNDRDTIIKDETITNNININININDTTASGSRDSNNSNSITGVKDESSPTIDDSTVQNLGTKIPAKRTLDLDLESEQLDRKRARSHALIRSAELRKKLSLTHAIHPVSFYGHFFCYYSLFYLLFVVHLH